MFAIVVCRPDLRGDRLTFTSAAAILALVLFAAGYIRQPRNKRGSAHLSRRANEASQARTIRPHEIFNTIPAVRDS